jgi:Superinfection immunity protein
VDVITTLLDRLGQIWTTLSAVSVLWAVVAVLFALAVYFLPTILAAVLGHPAKRVVLIGVLDLFFGWTGLLWFALLGWAMLGRPREHEEGEVADDEFVPFIHTPGTS